MVKNLFTFKKGVALLGGVMMLLNVALPGLTYATENLGTSATIPAETGEVVANEGEASGSEDPGTSATIPAETGEVVANEGEASGSEDPGTSPTVPVVTEETLKEQFAKTVEEQMATIKMPAGTEKSYDATTKTVTITVFESAKSLTKKDIKGTNGIVALNTLLGSENVKSFKVGNQEARDVNAIKQADPSLAALKTTILADVGVEMNAQGIPSIENLGQFIGKTLTVAVTYGTDKVSVDESFSFKFIEGKTLEWKTDFDPSTSPNDDVKNFWTARPGTPFVDIKNKDNAKLSNLLGFVYQINNAHLVDGNNVGYTITKGDKVIAYGAYHREAVGPNAFQWSFRDWSTSVAYTAEATKYDEKKLYHDGPGGSELDDVEGINETILKAGEKVTILIKAKLANGEEATLTQDYTITQQDVINASIGEKITLTFKDGTTELGKQTLLSGTAAVQPTIPTKNGYIFAGWFAEAELKTAFDFSTLLSQDTIVYAKWTKKSSGGGSSSWSSSGGGGGGGSSVSKTTTETPKTENKSTEIQKKTDPQKTDEQNSLVGLIKNFVEENKEHSAKVHALAEALASVKNSNESQELKDAYTYAYLRGITTQPSIEKSELHRGLTRAEMAKMMSVFAMKVLGKKVEKTDTPTYIDVKNMEGDLPGFIQLAYQLQIMGIDAEGNPLPNFNPYGEVSRAEFATVLSRVLWGAKYNQEGKNFAEQHLNALREAKILKDTNPQMKELRGWVMLMLQRSEGVQ